jgi:type IV pilus assembly protein PilC
MPGMKKSRKKRGITFEEISAFCEQASMLMQAGVPIVQSVETIVSDMPDGALKEIYKTVAGKVNETGMLSSGLEAAGVFPDYLVQMVKVGEQTGRLDDTLEALAVHYDRLKTFQNQIRSAVLYPMILIGIMAGVIFILMNNVMPAFRQVYMELGSGGGAASAAMDFSLAAGTVIFIVLVALFVLIAVVLAVWKSKRGSAALAGFFTRLPMTKNISAKIATGKFASAMSIQLASGIQPEPAVEMASIVADNPDVSKKIETSKALAAQGVSWGRAIDQCGIFSDTENRLVKIGLKSGNLDKAMQKIAEVYDEEVEERFGRISGVIEPVMIAVLSAVIGVLLISVMLPLVNIMSVIG